jgi:hypothetical protein
LDGISYDAGFAYEIDAKLSETSIHIKVLSNILVLFRTVDRFIIFSFPFKKSRYGVLWSIAQIIPKINPREIGSAPVKY